MASPTEHLLRYIIEELSERGLDVTKTALVKLLYLSDVEAMRRGRPRVSSVEWIYYRYGPYAFEIEEAIRGFAGYDVDELKGVSSIGRRFVSYRSPRGHNDYAPSEIPAEDRAIILSIIDRWGGESLRALLNYVYFETEPMLEPEWMKPLKLDLITRREAPLSLAELVSRRLKDEERDLLMRAKERFWASAAARSARPPATPAPSPRYDDVFRAGMKVTDEAE